ncbi:putative PRE3-20S proteasome subunit [Tilletiaria anomala UBC 951]|uniref:Proteasome subunit beta n=1 Tax=Tilletiaria anomala (strain ATCC 24038 / CBS 436.72 / UBC 951) TaxID=1037660 RepID=A0A066V8N8_TILAU|nr:putative PRE3-20S proteasome subunit [Tilletiaria anomala UBC 951]KDN37821.1 putative PRE3-20S proteasome subunit [Tilletiaria anomala UBC 951]
MNVVDVHRLKEGEVDLGTSIMAVAFEGGVVIGADSRTTMGSYIANRVTDKLTHISDRIYCCRSGSAADTQAVADIVTYYMAMFGVEHGQPAVHTAAHLFQDMIYQNKDRLSAGIIVAGWDKKNGGSVWNVPLGGGLFQQPWAIGGSGSAYIYGYCDSTWTPGMNREQTIEFVKNALSLAMSRDGSSGGTIRMAAISEEGVERFFVPGDQLPVLSAKLV